MKKIFIPNLAVARFLLFWNTLFESFWTLKWPESFWFCTLQGTIVITVFLVTEHPLFKCLKFLPWNCFSNVEMYTHAIVILLPFQPLINMIFSQEFWWGFSVQHPWNRFPITSRKIEAAWNPPIQMLMKVLRSGNFLFIISTAFAYIAWSKTKSVSFGFKASAFYLHCFSLCKTTSTLLVTSI